MPFKLRVFKSLRLGSRFSLKRASLGKTPFKPLSKKPWDLPSIGSWAIVKKPSQWIKKHKTALACAVSAFLISDLLLIASQRYLLVKSAHRGARKPLPIPHASHSVRKKYDAILKNNIFHTGPIPSQPKEDLTGQEPVLSELPFELKGTIVHANPRRSVATIVSGLKSKSYMAGELIENQAKITEIQRGQVSFLNLNNNRPEYIVIKKIKMPQRLSYIKPPAAPRAKNSPVRKTGPNNFQVKRSDIHDHLNKLPNILQEARVVPHPTEGPLEGWRFASIDQGSIIEKLGFQPGDVIKEVNGERVDSPEKAIELYEKLKSSSALEILVERDGKETYREYNVHEDVPIK